MWYPYPFLCCKKLYEKRTFFCFSKLNSKAIPSTPHDIISPAPTVAIKDHIGAEIPYPYTKINGTTKVLAIIGGTGAKNLFCFLRAYVAKAASRVVKLPNITSIKIPPVNKLLSKHPTKRPGIAAGRKNGKIVRASESRTWMAPDANPRELAIKVKTT